MLSPRTLVVCVGGGSKNSWTCRKDGSMHTKAVPSFCLSRQTRERYWPGLSVAARTDICRKEDLKEKTCVHGAGVLLIAADHV